MFYHETAFVHPRPHGLPFLGNMDTFLHGPGFNPEQIIFEFTHPDIETVVKTIEIHVFPSVIINEKSVVDTLLSFDHRFLLLLHKRTQRRIGHRDADMRLRGEKHIKRSVDTVNLRSPKPAVSVYVVLMQGQAFGSPPGSLAPGLQIIGFENGDSMLGLCSVSVIRTVMQQNKRIGQRHMHHRTFLL